MDAHHRNLDWPERDRLRVAVAFAMRPYQYKRKNT